MNIIIHAHKLSKYGGLERIIAELSNAMSDRGHNIFLFSDESLDVPPVYTLNDDIRRIHFTYNGDSRRLPAAPSASSGLQARCSSVSRQRHGTLAVVRGSAANGRPLDIFGTQQSGAYRKRALECEGAQGRVVRRGCGSFAFEYICGIRTRLCAGQSLRYTQRDLRACISQLLEGCNLRQPSSAFSWATEQHQTTSFAHPRHGSACRGIAGLAS